MTDGTTQYKIFTLDGGGGTSIFNQGKPFFWGTRAITPNDPLPGLFKYTHDTIPAAKTVGFVGWDIGEPSNSIVKADILKKIAAGGYQFNNLYELVPVGNQDFSQVLPKIKANEPDILLQVNYGQDPGSFANQASTAGLKAVRFGFEFTPDGLNASKGTAPETLRPLMKKAGVPDAPTPLTSAWSRLMRASCLFWSSARLKAATSSPSSWAAFSRLGRSSAGETSKSLSCMAQNFALPPWARASSAAMADGRALAWKGSGLCLNAKRTLPA